MFANSTGKNFLTAARYKNVAHLPGATEKKHERKKKRLMELLKMFFFCVLRKVGKVFHFVFIQRHDYFFLPCTMVFMCIYALRGYSSFSLRLLVCTLDWIA